MLPTRSMPAARVTISCTVDGEAAAEALWAGIEEEEEEEEKNDEEEDEDEDEDDGFEKPVDWSGCERTETVVLM